MCESDYYDDDCLLDAFVLPRSSLIKIIYYERVAAKIVAQKRKKSIKYLKQWRKK
jgi:hypothetical protein